ncbi:MAG: XisI protein [Cyanobacteria bacterium P01_E01_bin.42]
MVDLEKYRQIVRDLLQEIYGYNTSGSNHGIESQLVLDMERDHYLLIDVGWEQNQFIYGTSIHIDIKEDKIWIQRNNTEVQLAKCLVERGVSKDNIVIGLHSPFMRKYSDYAVS